MSTVLITGGTGFLGSHLRQAILASSDHFIILAIRSAPSKRRDLSSLAHPRTRVFEIDLSDIDRVFVENHIDLILHCATEYGRTDNSLGNVLEANLVLPIRLLEKAVQHGVRGFINVDSYFNKENLSYSHLLNYSLSKKSFLFWLKAFSKRIQVTNVVLEHIYGEGDRQDKFVEGMVRRIAFEQVVEVDLSPGDQKRDFIYVDDVVEAFMVIIEHSLVCEYRFKSFEVGTGTQMSIREFLENLKRIANSTVKLNFGAVEYREDEILSSCADILELKSLGWSPKISVVRGLQKIIDSYQKTGAL